VVGTGFLDGVEEFFPGAGMGEAAEVAGDGVGFAVFGREGAPGIDGAGQVEYGVEAGAEVADLAAGRGGGEDVGEEGEELGVGEGVGAHGELIGAKSEKSKKFLLSDMIRVCGRASYERGRRSLIMIEDLISVSQARKRPIPKDAPQNQDLATSSG
jgi:hypothetical protein